ncbi:MAG: hypothetical protein GX903_04745 [Spirochaetales bacterium]|nr:hypothetical protein [Spirochaetales bacterium]
MIVFDILDVLETYAPLHPMMQHVITVLDRSLPYTQEDGLYACPECKELTYKVESFVTSGGIQYEGRKDCLTLEITLSNSQLISFDSPQSVYRLAVGRFIYTDEPYKRGICINLPERIKTVQFYLPKI